MSGHVLGVYILPLYRFLLDFETVPTLWYFLFFILRHLWVVYDEVTIVFIYCFLEDDKDLLSAILIRLRQDMEIVLTFFYDFFTG
jgi:hypothetical protein